MLFAAKINSLDGLRRERVSADDYGTGAAVADYLPDKSVTNELAVLTPYEVNFRCFSSELAGVLAGFGGSPYALLVKTINVEPSAGTAESAALAGAAAPAETPEAPMAQRFPGGVWPRPGAAGATLPHGLSGPKGGLPTVLDERQLKVTIGLSLVKLLPVPAK